MPVSQAIECVRAVASSTPHPPQSTLKIFRDETILVGRFSVYLVVHLAVKQFMHDLEHPNSLTVHWLGKDGKNVTKWACLLQDKAQIRYQTQSYDPISRHMSSCLVL